MKLYVKRRPVDYIVYSAIIAMGIVLDQITKWLSVENLKKLDTLPLIEDILHLTYVENRGAAFGMMADQRWVFITVSSIAILAFGAYLYLGHADGWLTAVGMSLIISGGIGNMIDRVGLGYVVDFIDCRFVKYPVFNNGTAIWRTFPVFNGADSFVCVGAGIIVLAVILEMRAELKRKHNDNTGK